MTPREVIKRLRDLVKGMVSARVNSKNKLRAWFKDNEQFVSDCLAYERKPGMPPATPLVSAHFHPNLPLIGLNYTGVAHNTLHAFPEGWTMPLRYCRGIVFDRRGALVAWPFEKFFNYGEHPDSLKIPDGPVMATEKHDGHLGIVFRYRGQFIITTRGTFTYKTAEFGQQMLDRLVKKKGWAKIYPDNFTLLVEIIHPETEVHLDYDGAEELILIGARHNRRNFVDYGHEGLNNLGRKLGLKVTLMTRFPDKQSLVDYVSDPNVRTREGLVLAYRDEDGTLHRVKFKFHGYVGLMFAAKNSFRYVLARIMADDLDDRLAMMPPKESDKARAWAAQAMEVRNWTGTQKERWTRLYTYLPKGQDTAYSKQICRNYVKWLDEQGDP